jgi:hypothetical protein
MPRLLKNGPSATLIYSALKLSSRDIDANITRRRCTPFRLPASRVIDKQQRMHASRIWPRRASLSAITATTSNKMIPRGPSTFAREILRLAELIN